MFQYILCIFIYCVQHVRDCAHVHAHVEARGHCVSFSIILSYALETGSLVNLEACHFGQVSQLVSVSNLSVPAPQCPGYRCVQPNLVFCMGVGKLNFSAHVCTAHVFAHNTHSLNYLPSFFALNLFQLLFMCMCVSTCVLLFVCEHMQRSENGITGSGERPSMGSGTVPRSSVGAARVLNHQSSLPVIIFYLRQGLVVLPGLLSNSRVQIPFLFCDPSSCKTEAHTSIWSFAYYFLQS